ncbi:hemin uptake protein HemP [Ideonella sp. DXS29W]|uniref:Hemin uptake protein HemP n=1 Tax=Ideonella lacteola TaxID=2984193 RepID=A0ABU9BRW6_9BURK
MRSKTLALVSTPTTSSLSTGIMTKPLAPLSPTEQPQPAETAGLARPRQLDLPNIGTARPMLGEVATPLQKWASQDLLAGADEAIITHGDQVYRLRRTLTGKLILTK